ncbi:MAG: DNA-3-methyladenine glycosylase family protein [Thermoanaerobaculia bacterium]
MNRESFPIPKDFSFPATVESHGWYVLAPFRWDRAKGALSRTEFFESRHPEAARDSNVPATAQPRPKPPLPIAIDVTIRAVRRELVIESDHDLTPLRDALTPRIVRMFQLEVPLGEFHELCARSATHQPIAEEKYGRLLCGATLFEDVVKIIATTNTTWRQTVRMVENLCRVAGTKSAAGNLAFPTPAQVAAIDAATLQEECRLGYRAAFIHALASGIVDGSIALDAIAGPFADPKEQMKSYKQLPGIGPYGAAHLMAMDGRHDYIAVDTEFRTFVRTQYHGGRKVADKTMLRRYAKWGRWQYLAYWSDFWMSIREKLR